MPAQPLLLLLAVIVVGVLHTLVPDHWAPIALLARQRGWTTERTARAAALAGLGHTASTLLLAGVVWIAGAALAVRYGNAVNAIASAALIAFGAWIAIGSLRNIAHNRAHGHSHLGHAHAHRHEGGAEHRHWHEHHEEDMHADGDVAPHRHVHETSSRTALLLIIGSSPMAEGIPPFFAAGRFGPGLLGAMAFAFALSTILTYVVLCTISAKGMQRMDLGRFEQYGEVISGSFIALLGIVFLAVPRL